jgi:hypothetical protein
MILNVRLTSADGGHYLEYSGRVSDHGQPRCVRRSAPDILARYLYVIYAFLHPRKRAC